MSSHRILYVGHNHALLKYLEAELRDCFMVRCPDGSTAHVLIKGVTYSLLLFDEELSDTTGIELAEFACSLGRKPCTSLIIVKKEDNFESLRTAIMEVLTV